MAPFRIDFKSSVEKDLRRLPAEIISRSMEKIENLEFEPFPPQSIKVSGSERLHRLGVGDYRIIYEVDAVKKVITIHYIRPRSIVYRNL
jgi:mRNA interferase RelE/StbE